MKQVHLLTGNPDKIKAANLIFNKHDVEVLPLDLGIPEIQSTSSTEIARYMAEQAYKMTGKPIIREDHSFFIKELGFPGPFMAYAIKRLITLTSSRSCRRLKAAKHTLNWGQPMSMQAVKSMSFHIKCQLL
jgi:inosine/xanthosine triphosphate pyrophosphatase family protein